MKTIARLALTAAILTALAPTSHSNTSALALVRVHVTSADQAAELFARFDETHNHSPGEIELLLWPGDRLELDSLGLDYEVITENIYARDLALAQRSPAVLQQLPGPDREDYRHLADYNAEMQELAAKNKDLVEVFEMKRPTLEGRQVFGIEIAADVAKDDGRPIFYMDGVHHAREWPAAEYTMIFAHYLVEGFGKDPRVTSLLKKARVILVPIVNVDGFDYSRESVLSANQALADNTDLTGGVNGFEGYWRKNRRSLTGVTVPGINRNPDAFGVDPNRNYSYLWGDNQGGSSGSQVDQTYRGEAPFSEPEAQNVRDIILSRSVTGVITNHTYQGSVLRAGGGDAPEDGILVEIGDRMAKLLGYRNVPTVGYPTTGTTDDWAYAAMAALGFTIEHGIINFHPPYADEVGKFWKQHMDAFMVMLEASADPKYHSVITGKVSGGAATITLKKRFKTPLSEGNPTGEKSVVEKINMTFPTASNGSFELHVSPSSRPYEKGTESFEMVIKGKNGQVRSMRVEVARGEIVNLGKILWSKGVQPVGVSLEASGEIGP